MFLVLIVLYLGHVTAYLEAPLVRAAEGTKVSYGIPIIINDYQYNIGVALNSDGEEYIKPASGLHKKKEHTSKSHKKEQKNHQFTNGLLKASSLEGYTVEGWRRFFMEAVFFAQKRYDHELSLELDFMEVRDKGDKLNNGSMNLAPLVASDKMYLQIKKNSELIQNDVFAIYLGARESDDRIQLGGYEDDYGRFYEGKKFQTVKAADSNTSWLLPTSKIMFSKEHANKWQEFTLTTAANEVKLSLDSNTVIVKAQLIDKLEMALQTQSITCKMEDQLVCTNITSIELSLHMLVFQLAEDFFVNISLYRMLDKCDDHQHKCSFHLYVGEQYRLGEQFFRQYYTAFDMTNRTITLALCNKYPETWFSTVYILRFLIGFFLLIVVSALIAAAPQFYERFSYWRKRRSGLQGIELVNQQSLAVLEQ